MIEPPAVSPSSRKEDASRSNETTNGTSPATDPVMLIDATRTSCLLLPWKTVFVFNNTTHVGKGIIQSEIRAFRGASEKPAIFARVLREDSGTATTGARFPRNRARSIRALLAVTQQPPARSSRPGCRVLVPRAHLHRTFVPPVCLLSARAACYRVGGTPAAGCLCRVLLSLREVECSRSQPGPSDSFVCIAFWQLLTLRCCAARWCTVVGKPVGGRVGRRLEIAHTPRSTRVW
mmetsp:Transcript_17873/g.40891  ORF Transcript_17873/g.40891 Transcript_17873/m.40891 type:complete len:234 (-) Transcript_17873:209-910(-)